MSLEKALKALKNRDFVKARDLVAGLPIAQYTLSHYLIKGLCELSLEDWGGAETTFQQATEQFPDHALLYLNRGIAEENLGRLDAARRSHEKCIALNPSQGEAYGNLSNLFRKLNMLGDAEKMAHLAIAHNASKGEALNSLGLALVAQGRRKEAHSIFQEAQKASPDHAPIYLNQANLAADHLDFNEAWDKFSQARSLKDSALFRHDEALVRLLAGDVEAGWALFESRLELPGALRLKPTCPRWNGDSLTNKRLLILAEQGFGDAIQFCRYQDILPEGDIIWAFPKPLVRLMSKVLKGTVVDEASTLPPCDFYIPLLSLPYVTRRYELPPLPPTLFAMGKEPILPQTSSPRAFGLVWAGSPTHGRDQQRSIPLGTFAPLLHSCDAQFFAPFTGPSLDDINRFPIMRLDHLIQDFADTAALLKQLDAVITVDTSVAHLAGSLGMPTYLLVSYCPDWRWGTSGYKTSLYPSMTILRQSKGGDWKSVITELKNLLESGF